MANACNMGGTATAPSPRSAASSGGACCGGDCGCSCCCRSTSAMCSCIALSRPLPHWAAAPGASAGLVTIVQRWCRQSSGHGGSSIGTAESPPVPRHRVSSSPELLRSVTLVSIAGHGGAPSGHTSGSAHERKCDEQRRPTARGASDDDGMIADAPRWRSSERRWCCQPRTKSSTPVGAPRPSSASARPRVRIASAAATTASRDASDGHIARRKWKSEPTSDACASVAMCSDAAPAASATLGAKCSAWSGMSWDGRTRAHQSTSCAVVKPATHASASAETRCNKASDALRLSDSVARTPRARTGSCRCIVRVPQSHGADGTHGLLQCTVPLAPSHCRLHTAASCKGAACSATAIDWSCSCTSCRRWAALIRLRRLSFRSGRAIVLAGGMRAACPYQRAPTGMPLMLRLLRRPLLLRRRRRLEEPHIGDGIQKAPSAATLRRCIRIWRPNRATPTSHGCVPSRTDGSSARTGPCGWGRWIPHRGVALGRATLHQNPSAAARPQLRAWRRWWQAESRSTCAGTATAATRPHTWGRWRATPVVWRPEQPLDGVRQAGECREENPLWGVQRGEAGLPQAAEEQRAALECAQESQLRHVLFTRIAASCWPRRCHRR